MDVEADKRCLDQNRLEQHYNLSDYFLPMTKVPNAKTDPRLKSSSGRWDYVSSLPEAACWDFSECRQLLQLLLFYHDDVDALVEENPDYAFLLHHARPSWISPCSSKDVPSVNAAPATYDSFPRVMDGNEQKKASSSKAMLSGDCVTPETEAVLQTPSSCLTQNSGELTSHNDPKSLDHRGDRKSRRNAYEKVRPSGFRRETKRQKIFWSDMPPAEDADDHDELLDKNVACCTAQNADEAVRYGCLPLRAKSPKPKSETPPTSGSQVLQRKAQAGGRVLQEAKEPLSAMSVDDFVRLWHKAERLHSDSLVPGNTRSLEVEEYLALVKKLPEPAIPEPELPEPELPEEEEKSACCATRPGPSSVSKETKKLSENSLEPRKQIATKRHLTPPQISGEPSRSKATDDIQTQAKAAVQNSTPSLLQETGVLRRQSEFQSKRSVTEEQEARPNSALERKKPVLPENSQSPLEVAASACYSPSALQSEARPTSAGDRVVPLLPRKPQLPRTVMVLPTRWSPFDGKKTVPPESVQVPTKPSLGKRPLASPRVAGLPGQPSIALEKTFSIKPAEPLRAEKPPPTETTTQPPVSVQKETHSSPAAKLEKDFLDTKPESDQRFALVSRAPPVDMENHQQPQIAFASKTANPQALAVLPRQLSVAVGRAVQPKRVLDSKELLVRTKIQPPSKEQALRHLPLLAVGKDVQPSPRVVPTKIFVESNSRPLRKIVVLSRQLPVSIKNGQPKSSSDSDEIRPRKRPPPPRKPHGRVAGLSCPCSVVDEEQLGTKPDADSKETCTRSNPWPSQTVAVSPCQPWKAMDNMTKARSSEQSEMPTVDEKAEQQQSVDDALPTPVSNGAEENLQPESSCRAAAPVTPASPLKVAILPRQPPQAGKEILQPLSPAYPVNPLLFQKPPPARRVAASHREQAVRVGRRPQSPAGVTLPLSRVSRDPRASQHPGTQSSRSSASSTPLIRSRDSALHCPYTFTVTAETRPGPRGDHAEILAGPESAKPCERSSLASRLNRFLFKRGKKDCCAKAQSKHCGGGKHC